MTNLLLLNVLFTGIVEGGAILCWLLTLVFIVLSSLFEWILLDVLLVTKYFFRLIEFYPINV